MDSAYSSSWDKIRMERDAPLKSFFQCRYTIALMGFLTYAVLHIQLISTSVSIVAMVNNSAIHSQEHKNGSLTCSMNIQNSTSITTKKSSGEFNWSPQTQGYILGSSQLGFVITHMPGGLLSETIGAKITLTSGIFIASVCHLMSAFASWGSSYYMIVVQLVRGMGQGLLPASNFVLAANWIPSHERGRTMTFIMCGLAVGAIIGGVSSGAICASTLGWPAVYYIFGSLGLALSATYAIFAYESPKYHPRITELEKRYILENQETDLSKKRPSTPWRKILTSVPFYAMTAGVFGNFWASSHFLSVHPTFLGTILHFTIEENGLFASVPFALQTVFTLLALWISDWLIRNNYASLNKVRKGFNMLSCLGYSVCVFGLFAVGCDKTLSTFFSVMAIGFGGFSNAGCMINPVDLSPTFTGSIMGLCSLVACSANYIVPLVVGSLTRTEQSLEQWNKMFFISIAIVMSSGIIFCMFGSAEVQSWNYPSEEEFDKKKTENGIPKKGLSYNNTNYSPDLVSHL